MENVSILENIIKNIKGSNNARNVVIIPKNISKGYISKILKNYSVKNTNIYKFDEYIFKINEINCEQYIKSDLSYLENALTEANSVFNNYNLTNEAENILSIIHKIFFKKSLFPHLESFDENIILNNISKNFISYESKIFLEVLKMWLNKSKSSETYISKYLELLLRKDIFFTDAYHHTINLNDYENIEIDWITKNLPNNVNYNNSGYTKNINNDDFIPNSINSFKSYNFETQEDELEFMLKDILETRDRNNDCKIALINNDRYFARRLSALLEHNKISFNDNEGWLLSTSSCCSYINTVIKYFLECNNLHNFYGIYMSPYFKPNIDLKEKEVFFQNIIKYYKNNIKAPFVLSKNYTVSANIENIFFNIPDINQEYTFSEFKEIIESKIMSFGSMEEIQKDIAGSQFLKILKNINEIYLNSGKTYSLATWHKKLNNYLETKTFKNINNSNIDYIDIKHAALSKYDKIYINSMSGKNFPKKIINNFSINKILYSDLSINANEDFLEDIYDFLNLVKNTKQIIISFHASDDQDFYVKSKFKLFIDHYLKKNKNLFETSKKIIKKSIGVKKINLQLNDSFLNLTYRDIENYNFCRYCFYLNKTKPKKNYSIIEKNYSVYGNFVHTVLAETVKNISNKSKYDEILCYLEDCTKKNIEKYFHGNVRPFEVNLWYKLLPTMADYFYKDIDKKYNFISEGWISKQLNNGISLNGRFDLKYSIGKDTVIVDYKTGTNTSSRDSVISGESLQLPFYTLIDNTVTMANYLLINTSKKSINNITYSSDKLNDARTIILETCNKIYSHINNKKYLSFTNSQNGCEVCGFKEINNN